MAVLMSGSIFAPVSSLRKLGNPAALLFALFTESNWTRKAYLAFVGPEIN